MLGLFLSISTVFAADPPAISLAPLWRPSNTLDSIDLTTPNIKELGDEFRYVDVDLYVNTNVQFWAVQITCTATPAAPPSLQVTIGYTIGGTVTYQDARATPELKWSAQGRNTSSRRPMPQRPGRGSHGSREFTPATIWAIR